MKKNNNFYKSLFLIKQMSDLEEKSGEIKEPKNFEEIQLQTSVNQYTKDEHPDMPAEDARYTKDHPYTTEEI